MGFVNIDYEIKYDLIAGWLISDGQVSKVSIDGDSSFYIGDIFNKNDPVVIMYHTFKSNQPYDDSWMPDEPDYPHEDKVVTLTVSSSELKGKKYDEVTSILGELGFYNIKYDFMFDLDPGFLDTHHDDGNVDKVIIYGYDYFKEGDTFFFWTSSNNKISYIKEK